MHEVLVCVIQPCPRGESEDRRLRFNLHANEADRSCAQESKEMIRLTQEYVTVVIQSPSPRVRELSIYWIQYGSEKNASLQANVDEHRRLIPVNSSIEHVHDANRGRW
jgi:hypothetical protein